MQITYVTGNKYKIELAQRILGPLGVQVLQKKIYCPEIQDDKIENVISLINKLPEEITYTTDVENKLIEIEKLYNELTKEEQKVIT